MPRLRHVALACSSAAVSAFVLSSAACGDSTLSNIPYGSSDGGGDAVVLTTDGSSSGVIDSTSPVADAASGPVRSVVAVGDAFACLLAKDHSVWCWGRNDVGQLGQDPAMTPLSCGGGSIPCSPSLVKVNGLSNIDRIAVGDDFACALDSIGTVWCWGSNAKGQLSTGEASAAMSFTPRKIILDVAEISAGGKHACVISKDGLVRCWGENTCDIFGFGQGSAGATQVVAKQLLLPIQRQVSLGPDAMCATDDTGQVLCWGADHNGSLGHTLESAAAPCGGFPTDPVPKHVQAKASEVPIDGISDTHMGYGVACARRANDGQVMCWGDNRLGALGQGAEDATPHPRAIDVPALKAVQLDVHGQTACVITAQTLICWGDSRLGQLDSEATGCGGQGCRPLGYAIPGMNPVRELAIGNGSIATIKDDLTLWAWGRNDSSELGLPITDPANKTCSASVCVPKPKQVATVPVLF